MNEEIAQQYGNRLRTRVCGLCWQGDDLLLINHKGLTDNDFWAPPGGGVEFGESLTEAVIREFREETGLEVIDPRFMFTCEFIGLPLHSLEFFFEIPTAHGDAHIGSDPETKADNQIIKDLKYLKWGDIMAINSDKRHGIFHLVKTGDDLKKLSGYYQI